MRPTLDGHASGCRPLVVVLAVVLVVVLALAAPATATRARAQAPAAPTPVDSVWFPRVEGTNLEKKTFTLPSGFEGDWNVVIVAFRREQQADVDTWTAPLAALLRGRPDVSTYELPTLTRSYRWVRPMIDGGMARGIPDKRVRERTITLYIDKTPFKRALGIPDEDRIRVFLVGRAGRVYWRAVGRWTAEAGDSLRAVLDAVAASSPVVMLDVRPARGDVRRAVTPAPHLEEPRASATRHHTARV